MSQLGLFEDPARLAAADRWIFERHERASRARAEDAAAAAIREPLHCNHHDVSSALCRCDVVGELLRNLTAGDELAAAAK